VPARGRRAAASPSATIGKKAKVRLTKEERNAKRVAEGDLISSDGGSEFLDSVSGGDMSDGDGLAPAAALGFSAPPLAAGEVGAASN
jgi:hypothetical protein